MAVAKISLYSESLGSAQDLTLILPSPTVMQTSAVLYLLHGLLDGHETWVQRTRLVEYAELYNLVVVMPNAQRSFYTDQTQGYAWRTWVEQELPAAIEQWLALPIDPVRHIAGLSMGGYGAVKLGLSQPKRFTSIGSFSGVLDLTRVTQGPISADIQRDIEIAFGGLDQVAGSKNDLMTLTSQASLPYLYVTCGTEDTLLEGNRTFISQLQTKHKNMDYHEMPGGHEWSLWDKNIAEYLQSLHQKQLLNLASETLTT